MKRQIAICLVEAAAIIMLVTWTGVHDSLVLLAAVLFVFGAMFEYKHGKEEEEKELNRRVEKLNQMLAQKETEEKQRKAHADFIRLHMQEKLGG